ncbi:uncharacterized protein J3D65DRAFT_630046 [Phyllosticta citribraziliensis]|uniref:Uncharacterized protein n=1 Tax=Phyllosticta citribraziliensis TaxID=989973 RepID=A0ABR1LMD7_9PEZI
MWTRKPVSKQRLANNTSDLDVSFYYWVALSGAFVLLLVAHLEKSLGHLCYLWPLHFPGYQLEARKSLHQRVGWYHSDGAFEIRPQTPRIAGCRISFEFTMKPSSQERPDSPMQSTARLSLENLRAHEASCPTTDTHYAEYLVFGERNHEFYEELCRGCCDGSLPEVGDAVLVPSRLNDFLKMEPGPRSSSETPLRRYVTIGAGEDPFPLYAKREMKSMHIRTGSMSSVELRRDAAQRIDRDLEGMQGEKDPRMA